MLTSTPKSNEFYLNEGKNNFRQFLSKGKVWLREAAKKVFCGPYTKAPPPLSLLAILFSDFFRASKKVFFSQ